MLVLTKPGAMRRFLRNARLRQVACWVIQRYIRFVYATNRWSVEGAERPRRLTREGRSFIVAFWHGHRAVLRATGGRFGLWRPKPGGWGALCLTTTGRRSGRTRRVVLGYVEDGRNLVTMAMNGWGPAEPAWWLNLQANPDAVVRTRDGVRPVRARRARGEERERLWARWAEIDKDLEDFASRRPHETAVVVLEPRDGAEPDDTTGGRR